MPTERIVINPGLLAALAHYSKPRAPVARMDTVFTFQRQPRAKGPPTYEHWTVDRTCSMAWDLLSRNNLAEPKLRTLVQELERWGMGPMYERAMGEPISQALDAFK